MVTICCSVFWINDTVPTGLVLNSTIASKQQLFQNFISQFGFWIGARHCKAFHVPAWIVSTPNGWFASSEVKFICCAIKIEMYQKYMWYEYTLAFPLGFSLIFPVLAPNRVSSCNCCLIYGFLFFQNIFKSQMKLLGAIIICLASHRLELLLKYNFFRSF